MPDLKSSATSRHFEARQLGAVTAVLAAISVAALVWCAAHGYTLYYGDAEAHLNIARRIFDSRTPGWEQLGSVWLPLPHLLMLPFVVWQKLWRRGLAGAIPSAASFVAAGMFLFAAARRVYLSAAAAMTGVLLFALNPNMLYLQSVPMTEALFAATLAALLWSTVWFRDSQSIWAVLGAAAASNAASLTRYEGWFLIPFLAIYFLTTARIKMFALVFTCLAALGPLAWLAHNRYYYSNPLEFYNGEGSAQQIYAGELAAGGARYPGDHHWRAAIAYYFEAVKLTEGWPLLALGALGAAASLRRAGAPAKPGQESAQSGEREPLNRRGDTRLTTPRRDPAHLRGAGPVVNPPPSVEPDDPASAELPMGTASGPSLPGTAGVSSGIWWPLFLLALPPVFYVWSIHSSGTPLFVPTLWPHSWYNTRYALAALPWAAFAAAGVVALMPAKMQTLGAVGIVLGVSLMSLRAGVPICWKESSVNSTARRAWTARSADYLAAHYQPGDGIIYSFGDLTGVLREAGIPLRESLHQGNHPAWDAAVIRPDLFFREEWALAIAGDKVAGAVLRTGPRGPHYQLKRLIEVEGTPAVSIYQRQLSRLP